jgi:hypothetical protein
MTEYLLTFELEREGDKLCVHGTAEALEEFARSLTELAKRARSGVADHIHWMTEDWGGPGAGLTSTPQSESSQLIHHVKVFGWPEDAQ